MMGLITNLSTQEYIDNGWDKCKDFIFGVENGTIPSGKYIKKQVQLFKQYASDVRYEYKVEEVDKVFKFFSYLSISKNDEYVQFPLTEWQAFFIALVFGFYIKGTNNRKHREAFLLIARKNGKTAFSSAITLYGLMKDNVADPQVILLAITTRQAHNCLKYAKSIISHSTALNKRLKVTLNQITTTNESDQGFMEVMSSVEPERLEGFSPSMAVLDEVHGYDNSKAEEVYNSIKQGTGARSKPLIILATTAGTKDNQFITNHIELYKNMLDGIIVDERKCGLLFMPDEGDDLSKEEIWFKANPSLYEFPTLLEDLNQSFIESQNSVTARSKYQFLTRRLNIFLDEPTEWITQNDIRPLFDPTLKLEDYYGSDVYLGLDLSLSSDLSALSIAIGNNKDIKIFTKYFMGNNPDKLVRKGKFDLTPHIQSGLVHRSEFKTVDYMAIKDYILELANHFNIIKLGYDKYNASLLISEIQDEVYCEVFGQWASKFNFPLKYMETLVSEKAIHFAYNPVLLWNFGNVVITEGDANGNIRINKNKKKDAVDGVVATAMAMGIMLEYLNPLITN